MNQTTQERRRRRTTRGILLPLLLCLSLVVAACSENNGGNGATPPDDGAPFYAGKSIELIVPFAPGGGSDLVARLVADILSDTIEGNPTIFVLNVPGADGMIGNNLFVQREADGLTLLQGAVSATFAQVFGSADANFDYGDWHPLLAGPQGAIVYARPDTGITHGSELVDPPVELVFGSGGTEGSDLSRLAALDLLEVPFRTVIGFPSGGEQRLAFQQGQINLSSDATIAYAENVQPLVDDGEAVPMFSLGLVDDGELVADTAFPEIPTFADIYRDVNGSDPEGVAFEGAKLLVNAALAFNKVLFIQDDAPDEAKEALQAGLEELLTDQRYLDALDTILGGYEFVIGEQVVNNLDALLEVEPEVTEWVVNWANETYDSQLGS